jgi:hypothetical protein
MPSRKGPSRSGYGLFIEKEGKNTGTAGRDAVCYEERAALTNWEVSNPWGTKSCISATDQSGVVAVSGRKDGVLVFEPGHLH